MSGDKLNVLFFVASIGAAGVLGAIATDGIRARVLWAVGLAGLVASLAAMQADARSPFVKLFRMLFVTGPFIGVALALLVSGGRKPLEPKKRPFAQPAINPGLTAQYLEGIVTGGTHLEAQRRIDGHRHQRARLVGQVRQIKKAIYPEGVTVDASFPTVTRTKTLHFKKGQEDALAVIKINDWIEFSGAVEHTSVNGWEMKNCEFIGLAQAPKQVRARGPRA